MYIYLYVSHVSNLLPSVQKFIELIFENKQKIANKRLKTQIKREILAH